MGRPNGFLWLFAHEVRILWRGSILVRTRRHVILPIIAVGLIFQAAALAIADAAVKQHLSLPILILIGNLNLVFLFFLMLSRAMTSAIDVLYARGDVDFLLASPIPPARVLAVRMLGVAAATASPWMLLGGVLANALAMFGHPQALAAYPMIFAIALIATALSFALVVVLVAQIGPRAARNLAHTLALAVGVLIFVLGQAPHYLPAARLARLWRGFMPDAAHAGGLAWVPGRAMLGQPVPLAIFIAASAAIFVLVLVTLGQKFADGAISAAAFKSGNAAGRQTSNFRQNPFAATMRKDLRLLARFPGLVTQTVYRSLSLVPVAMILTGRVAIGAGPQIVVPLVVFLSGQLALFFGSVIVNTDQSPELLRAAPVPTALAQRASTAAAAYATALIMALPYMGILIRDPKTLPLATAAIIGATISNLTLAQKFPIPLTRADFGKSQKGTLLGLILGVAASTAWAGAAWLGVLGK